MRLVYFVIFLVLAAEFSFPASAKFEVIAEPFFGPQHPWDLKEKSWCSDFAEDAFTLRVVDEGKSLASWKYCAAYGKTKATGFTDRAGRKYVLLEYGEGHGSGMTLFYLEVDRIASGRHFEMARIPIAWPVFPGGYFEFSYTIENSPNSGLEITLHEKPDDAASDEMSPKELRPPERSQVLRFDVPK